MVDMVSKWFNCNENWFILSMAFYITSRLSHAAVIEYFVMLCLIQIYLMKEIEWIVPVSSLLYTYWYAVCPGAVLMV